MKFDVYYSFYSKKAQKRVPGVEPHPMEWNDIKKLMGAEANLALIRRFRESGDREAKEMLPSVCYVGRCMKTRAQKYMRPTQAVMLDVDHVEDPKAAYETMKGEVIGRLGKDWWFDKVLLWAITPSGRGLRGVVWANKDFDSLEAQMKYYNEEFGLSRFGDFDAPCKDFSRISFFFDPSEILFENAQLYTEYNKQPEAIVVNYDLDRKEQPLFDDKGEATEGVPQQARAATSKKVNTRNTEEDVPVFTQEEAEKLEGWAYNDVPVTTIIEKWIEKVGKPSPHQVHDYYQQLCRYFRSLCNNDAKVMFFLLPRYDHPDYECWKQCTWTCNHGKGSYKMPKEFFFFLKENGWYKTNASNSSLTEYLMQEVESDKEKTKLPWTPPVFRELLGTAPDDFKYPLLVGLLPIMGTLTSCVGAYYFYGQSEYHTTSFFSVIYAPAGTGKNFFEYYMNLLLEEIRRRDYVQNARETIYLNTINKKADNEKAPEDPHTSLRIIYPKNSESEFLGKQKENHGYHMFTFAAEMDSWAKGVKAAGGNKDDMLRIAWDNGDYGQNFKGAQTTKGGCNLYWNALITGTLPQVQNYYKNVENGLVTRTSFCSIDNQEFADAPRWKQMTPKQQEVVQRFIHRCDARSYMEPNTLLPEDIDAIKPSEFDEKVDWRFTFRPRKTVEMEWVRPTIEKWLKEQQRMAVRDYDKARDVFRRRVAVRGFRLALMCTMLWESPKKSDLVKCCDFIRWFMDNDMEQIHKLWAKSYNEVAQDAPNLSQKGVFADLPKTFTAKDVAQVCMKRSIMTPARAVISNWKRFGFVRKIGKNEFEKIERHEKESA